MLEPHTRLEAICPEWSSMTRDSYWKMYMTLRFVLQRGIENKRRSLLRYRSERLQVNAKRLSVKREPSGSSL